MVGVNSSPLILMKIAENISLFGTEEKTEKLQVLMNTNKSCSNVSNEPS
jgi:hypothetical protein